MNNPEDFRNKIRGLPRKLIDQKLEGGARQQAELFQAEQNKQAAMLEQQTQEIARQNQEQKMLREYNSVLGISARLDLIAKEVGLGGTKEILPGRGPLDIIAEEVGLGVATEIEPEPTIYTPSHLTSATALTYLCPSLEIKGRIIFRKDTGKTWYSPPSGMGGGGGSGPIYDYWLSSPRKLTDYLAVSLIFSPSEALVRVNFNRYGWTYNESGDHFHKETTKIPFLSPRELKQYYELRIHEIDNDYIPLPFTHDSVVPSRIEEGFLHLYEAHLHQTGKI